MVRKLSRIEKERYIALFKEEEHINYLKTIINQDWFLEFVYDDDFSKSKAFVYTENKTYIDDELTMLEYMQVYYARNKYELEEQAKDYQFLASDWCLSYGELGYFTNYFERLGKRFGLLKEFRENGII